MYAIKEVKDDGGQLALVVLEGVNGRKDPLDQVRNVQLRIDNNRITAINVDGEAVQQIHRQAWLERSSETDYMDTSDWRDSETAYIDAHDERI